MKDKNDNTFGFDATSFWKDLPQYERINYVRVTNQETGEVLLVPAKDLQKNSGQQVLQQVDKFYYRYNLLQQNINPEKTKQIAEWLREKSNLLRLVATQLAFHLLKLYEHLLRVNIETKQLLEIDVAPFTLINDEEGNPVEVKFNIDEGKMEQVVIFLEKSFAPGFDWARTWEVCAKEILTYLSVSALERMEKDLETKTIENMNFESREETFHRYINSEMSESLEEKLSLLLHNSSQQIVQDFITGLNLPNLSLLDLDKILGFKKYDTGISLPVTEPPLANSILPVSTGFPMLSSIVAQLRKDLWQQDVNKVAYCQYKAKGNPNNYIEHYITGPGDVRLLPWEQAEQIIDKFGFNTVKLHLIFAAHTMNHLEPWKNKFTLKGSDIIKELGWDRRNDLATYEKLNEIANTAYALGCLLLKAVWTEGNGKNKIDCSISTSRVWDVMVDVRSGQLSLEGKIDRPHEIYLTVRPGLWFEKFLNEAGAKAKEALYQFGYIAKQVLKIDPYHDELALRLAIYLTMDSRIHRSGEYRVKTLLEAPSVMTKNVLDSSRNDKRKTYELRQRWDNALKLLMNLGWQIEFDDSYPEWLRPGSKAQKSVGWREVKIIDWLLGAKITIKPPAPIPELLAAKLETKKSSKPNLTSSISLTGDQIRKAREGKGWSQRKLAGWMGVTQTLVGYWEKGKRTPSGDMETKLRHLLEITN
jgi:DNA-binding transcriptional regulator YiaG